MSPEAQSVRNLFVAAVRLPPEQWEDFLKEASAGDDELRRQVGDLLREHQQAGNFLDRPAAHVRATGEFDPSANEAVRGSPDPAPAAQEGPGALIGPYKLLELIGEGGMGVVWMAEQSKPVQRKVAFKIIKAGMDTRQVVARFEAERQALALMDHPHIAKVFDGGTTGGRPYFVMELVKGVPITRYCDEHRLTPRERLELFVPVCQAIQHAHTKGIIHRDLKPANVLVAPYDGVPVPKVIDFGVAKATGQRLTEKTLFTGFGAVVGTLEYMSPEQAELNNQDVDTRSDIYSLGVLLYELLTGTTPLNHERLKQAAFTETLRLIRDEEPPRPSTRLSESKETLPSIAEQRHTEPARLTKLLRGELDWIVMKALEKDRSRRYETANGFAMDVQRYLADESVLAGPPSGWYRFRKFTRRNKGRLAVAVGLFLAVTVMAATIGWAVRDRAARRANVASQVRDSLNAARILIVENKLTAARPKLAEARAQLGDDRAVLNGLAAEVEAGEAELDRFLQFVDLIDRAHEAETAPVLEVLLAGDSSLDSSPMLPPGGTSERRPAAAVPLLLQALQRYAILERDDWGTTLEGGVLGKAQIGHIQRLAYEELLWLADDLIHRQEEHPSGERLAPEAAAKAALAYLGKAETAHRPTQALYVLRAQCQQALGEEAASAADRQLAEKTLPALALDHYLRGQAAYDAGKLAEGVQAFEAALRLEPTHYWSLMKLGYCLCDLGQGSEDFVGAARVFTGCILHRPDHGHAYYCRGIAFEKLHRYGDALADYSRAIELAPRLASAWDGQATAYLKLGQPNKALAAFSKVIELDPKNALAWYNRGVTAQSGLGQPDKALVDFSKAIELNPKLATAWSARGAAYMDLAQLDMALADCSKAIDLDPTDATAWYNRGNALSAQGKYAEAEAEYREALRLRPNYHECFFNLGNSLRERGKYAEAEAEYREALRLRPESYGPHNNLGLTLAAQEKHAEAEAEYWQALRLRPDSPEPFFNLADSLVDQGKHAEAEAAYRQALALRPDFPEVHIAHNRLGNALSAQEKYTEAEREYRQALALRPSYPLAISNLGILLRRQGKPAAALHLYIDSFAADPTLGDDLRTLNRYNAACAAALVGCGLANDATGFDEAECARLRRQALDWLRADLAAWGQLLENEPDQARTRVQQALRMWQQDSDFAGVRGEALAKLPEAERQAWQQLWSDVEQTLGLAGNADDTIKKSPN